MLGMNLGFAVTQTIAPMQEVTFSSEQSASPSSGLKINIPEIVPPGLVSSMKAVLANHGIIRGFSLGI